MKISDIYDKYNVFPSLREHMFRVASVAAWIVEHATIPIDRQSLIEAALLHDIGNILKTSFTPDNKYLKLGDKSLADWQKIKATFQEKYGTDCDKATFQILNELKITPAVFELLEHLEFGYLSQILDSSLEKMILKYSDLRVTIDGIAPLRERINDIHIRYGIVDETNKELAHMLEHHVFNFVNGLPEEIISSKIEPTIHLFANFEIRTLNTDGML